MVYGLPCSVSRIKRNDDLIMYTKGDRVAELISNHLYYTVTQSIICKGKNRLAKK